MIKELKRVLDECFWNDNTIPPGRLKALFSPAELKPLLPEKSTISYINFRLMLIRSILFKSIDGGVRPWK